MNMLTRINILLCGAIAFSAFLVGSCIPSVYARSTEESITSDSVLLKTDESVEISQAELQVIDRYGSIAAFGRELAALQNIPPDERSPQQEQRLIEMLDLRNGLMADFNQFVDSVDAQRMAERSPSDPELHGVSVDELTTLQNQLQALEQNTVLFYPIVLDDRLELLILTPDAPPIRRQVEVSRVELAQVVLELRQALETPTNDPVPPAQQLYDWLIAPIEDELVAAETEMILYAPDSLLRYVPLVSLHDGDRWLVEQYGVNNITAVSLTDLTSAVQGSPRILAAAHTTGTFDVMVGDRSLQFPGFPGARAEVEAIAALMPGTTMLLDEEFSLDNLLPQINDYDIVHLATNALFVPGEPSESFILLGNGDVVTLADVRNWNLSNVDLMVLSACETGLGGFAEGKEILGFGYLVQQAGARAVVASLWVVDDVGTQVLMEDFYRSLQQGNSYADALRQAQLVAIQGALSTDQELSTADEDQEHSSTDFSHPFYWAPFILIGNGL